MALPAIASQLITLAYNLADTWFVGRTDNPYMVASCSLVLPIYMLTIVISNVFGVGGGTLITRLIGKREDKEASRVSSASIRMSIASAAVFSFLCFAGMTPILRFLGASDNILGFSKEYMFFVAVLGGIPVILSNTLSSLLRSIGLSAKASFGLSMGGLINIILDPLFMFVILPDGKQVLGAGAATFVSNVIVVLYFIITYKKAGKDTVLRFSIYGDRLSASHGDIELAAIGIVLKAERLPLNIGVGICMGMVPLLAFNYSSRNRERMDAVFRFGRGIGVRVGRD